jgi:hypothetical protein
LGIADLKSLTGADFDAKAYRQVSQHLHMGYLDRNDTLPFGDTWDDDERELITKLFCREMMPNRWERAQQILSTLKLPIQTRYVQWRGGSHAARDVKRCPVVFKGNDAGETLTAVVPHEYRPFLSGALRQAGGTMHVCDRDSALDGQSGLPAAKHAF